VSDGAPEAKPPPPPHHGHHREEAALWKALRIVLMPAVLALVGWWVQDGLETQKTDARLLEVALGLLEPDVRDVHLRTYGVSLLKATSPVTIDQDLAERLARGNSSLLTAADGGRVTIVRRAAPDGRDGDGDEADPEPGDPQVGASPTLGATPGLGGSIGGLPVRPGDAVIMGGPPPVLGSDTFEPPQYPVPVASAAVGSDAAADGGRSRLLVVADPAWSNRVVVPIAVCGDRPALRDFLETEVSPRLVAAGFAPRPVVVAEDGTPGVTTILFEPGHPEAEDSFTLAAVLRTFERLPTVRRVAQTDGAAGTPWHLPVTVCPADDDTPQGDGG